MEKQRSRPFRRTVYHKRSGILSVIVNFIDGSSDSTLSNGSLGLYHATNSSFQELSVPVGKICSSFTVELVAILEALRHILDLDPLGFCIFSDCKSAIQRISPTSEHPIVSKFIKLIKLFTNLMLNSLSSDLADALAKWPEYSHRQAVLL